MFGLFIGEFPEGEAKPSRPQESSLETGIIREGCSSEPTGKAYWVDRGTSYGNGERYDHEETPFMTKVPSKHDR